MWIETEVVGEGMIVGRAGDITTSTVFVPSELWKYTTVKHQETRIQTNYRKVTKLISTVRRIIECNSPSVLFRTEELRGSLGERSARVCHDPAKYEVF